jgi:hypothetical protein
MTSLLLRAVTARAGGRVAGGQDDLTFVPSGPLGVWVSRFDARPDLGRDEMLRHHRLVESICAAAPCLPVRLGTWAASEAEARQLLAAREEALLVALARVEGKVEVAVAGLWRAGEAGLRGDESAEPRAGGEGTRYLRRRRIEVERREARERRARELVALVETASGASGAAARHRACPSEALALSSALLVGRDEAEASIAALRALASRQADVELVVNGPWPPYSFAGIE